MYHSVRNLIKTRYLPTNTGYLRLVICLPLVLAACGISSKIPVERIPPATIQVYPRAENEVPNSVSESAIAPIPSSGESSVSLMEPLPTPKARRLRAGELDLAADEDDIPAIFAEDILFVDASIGSLEWDDKEPIIGLVVGDDARAYPVRLLSNHEIVNDTVGGEPVVITWCPLCFSSIVFSRIVDDRELTFGVSGYLYYDNLVMYDHRTNTLWSQLVAEAIKGAYRGERLTLFPSTMTSWGEWKERHPETLVLSAERLGFRAEDVFDPYVNYYQSGIAGLIGQENTDSALAPKELVVGLTIGAYARAYQFSEVRELVLINDTLGGAPLLLALDEHLDAIVVYRRIFGEQELTFTPIQEAGFLRDDETGSLWEIATGKAIEGPLIGNRLKRVAAPLVFWFAWSALYSESDVYGQ